MEDFRVNSPNEEKLIHALQATDSRLTYDQLTQITGLSNSTVRRLLVKLLHRRLVNRYTDGKTQYWSINLNEELPSIMGTPIQEWLETEQTNTILTEKFKEWMFGAVALKYIQPVYKLATGKTTDKRLQSKYNELIETARFFDAQSNLMREIAHHLYASNDADYDNWLNHKDYDPREAFSILCHVDSKTWTVDVVNELSNKWRDKKVG